MNSLLNTFADLGTPLSSLGEGTMEDQNLSFPQASDNLLVQVEDQLACLNAKSEIPNLWDAGLLDPLWWQYSYNQVRFERTGG